MSSERESAKYQEIIKVVFYSSGAEESVIGLIRVNSLVSYQRQSKSMFRDEGKSRRK